MSEHPGHYGSEFVAYPVGESGDRQTGFYPLNTGWDYEHTIPVLEAGDDPEYRRKLEAIEDMHRRAWQSLDNETGI